MIRRILLTYFITHLFGACQYLQLNHAVAKQIDQTDISLLKIGTIESGHIYSFNNEQNRAVGFDYELAQRFAEHLGVPLKMQPYASLDELFVALDKGEINIIAAGLVDTESRRTNYRLSPPLYQVDQLLIYRQGGRKPSNLNKLRGNLSVMVGSAYVDTLIGLRQQYPNLEWQLVDNKLNRDLLKMVSDRRLDYTITDSSSLQLNQRFFPELREAQVLVEDQNVVWVLSASASDALMSQLLSFWHKEQRLGTLSQLQEKYFAHVEQFDYVDTRVFMRAVKNTLPKYRSWFEQYAGELDWRKLAATSYQESHWDPLARSATGVRGLMMLTLPTAKQMGINNRLDPEQSIRGGAKYLARMLTRLPDSIPHSQKIWFALAAYNVGLGHVYDARMLAKKMQLNPDSWTDVKQILPLLQDPKYHSQTRYGFARGGQAVHYVDNIRRYYTTLIWLDKQAQRKQANYVNLRLTQSNSESAVTR